MGSPRTAAVWSMAALIATSVRYFELKSPMIPMRTRTMLPFCDHTLSVEQQLLLGTPRMLPDSLTSPLYDCPLFQPILKESPYSFFGPVSTPLGQQPSGT